MEISHAFAGLYSLLILIKSCIGYTIPLTGKWSLTDSNISVNFILNSTFGTDIYSVLQTEGFIPNPLTGYGDTKLRPLSYGNWTYSHYFFLDYKDTLTTIFLELDRIDSYCCVYLNHHLLICTDNSFIHYSVPISPFIRYSWNFLQLKFNSTTKMAESAYQKLAPNPPPPKCWPSTFNGECFINAVRTTQASFGWDWGPAFPIQGFWKTPVLRFNVLWLGDGVQFYPILKGSTWKAGVSVEILGGDPGSKVCVSVKLGGGLMKNWEKRCVLIERNGTNVWMELPLNGGLSVVPWWPIGVRSGPQLYALMIQLRNEWGGYPLDNRSFKVGFRQVELIQEDVKVDGQNHGKTFFFRINGVPIFVRGSNWIPSTFFPPQKDSQGELRTVRDSELLYSAVGAGIQMLRVWGGGRYEDRRFYDLASQIGIMIWQDMMFACAMYKKPADGEPDSVETEIRQQVRRLHHYPAIVIWATNNEVEVAAAQGWYGPGTDRLEYRRRFKDSIAKIVEENEAPSDQTVGYIPRKVLLSSPGNGDASKDPYGIDPNPQDPLAGDVHFYSYFGDLWDECTYPVTRFTSEYGIMSLPGPLAWLRSLDKNKSHPDDWDICGAMMLHRLHKEGGIEILRKYVFEKFGEPREGATNVENYIIWTYLTQLYQAIAYKTHINHLERHRCTISNGTPSDDCSNVWRGQGNSMGHLYWQLNDIWAAPTWSTIDVAGQWKIAHYLAIRGTSTITHPIGRIIVSQIHDQVLINWVPPIKPSTKSAITIRILCPSIASFDQPSAILFENRVEQWEPNGCPIRITKFQKNQLLSRCPWGVLTTMIDNGTQQTNDTALILTPKYMRPFWPKNVDLITVDSIKRVDRMYFSTSRPPFRWKQVFEISLLSDVPEFYIWLIVDPFKDIDGWFTDNAFSMVTSNRKTVLYFLKGNSSLSPDELKSAIKIYSLGSVLT